MASMRVDSLLGPQVATAVFLIFQVLLTKIGCWDIATNLYVLVYRVVQYCCRIKEMQGSNYTCIGSLCACIDKRHEDISPIYCSAWIYQDPLSESCILHRVYWSNGYFLLLLFVYVSFYHSVGFLFDVATRVTFSASHGTEYTWRSYPVVFIKCMLVSKSVLLL